MNKIMIDIISENEHSLCDEWTLIFCFLHPTKIVHFHYSLLLKKWLYLGNS